MNLWPDTAAALGLGKSAVYKAAHAGQIPVIRVGGRLLVPIAALEELLEGRSAGGSAVITVPPA